MPCWPDILEQAKRELPRIAFFTSAIGYLSIVALLLWAPKLHRRWVRIASRILGVLAGIPLVVLAPALFFGILLASGNPPTVSRSVYSPGGQEARVSYNGGFLGRDYTEVAVRSTSSCRHKTVFWHHGPSDPEDVQIDWVDNKHLHLSYHARPDDPVHCEPSLGEVMIVCTPLGKPTVAGQK